MTNGTVSRTKGSFVSKVVKSNFRCNLSCVQWKEAHCVLHFDIAYYKVLVHIPKYYSATHEPSLTLRGATSGMQRDAIHNGPTTFMIDTAGEMPSTRSLGYKSQWKCGIHVFINPLPPTYCGKKGKQEKNHV